MLFTLSKREILILATFNLMSSNAFKNVIVWSRANVIKLLINACQKNPTSLKPPLAFRFERADNTREKPVSTGNHAGTTFGT